MTRKQLHYVHMTTSGLHYTAHITYLTLVASHAPYALSAGVLAVLTVTGSIVSYRLKKEEV